MDDTILDISHISKRFGRFQALDDVSLSINKGEIYGLIGENGAGKTTLMRLITGLSPMQKGSIRLMGHTLGKDSRILSRIGSIIESPAAFKKLTVIQNMKLTAIQHGLADDKAIDRPSTSSVLARRPRPGPAISPLGSVSAWGWPWPFSTGPIS